jgi:hypothetical protein
MLKNILKLPGTEALTAEQKKSINGGLIRCLNSKGLCSKSGPDCRESQCRNF